MLEEGDGPSGKSRKEGQGDEGCPNTLGFFVTWPKSGVCILPAA